MNSEPASPEAEEPETEEKPDPGDEDPVLADDRGSTAREPEATAVDAEPPAAIRRTPGEVARDAVETISLRSRASIASHPKRWLAGFLTVALGLGGLVVLSAFNPADTEPQRLVREYLEALRDKDFDVVDEIVNRHPYPGDSIGDPALMANAQQIVDNDWTIGTVRPEIGYDESRSGDARVWATIQDSAGNETGHWFGLARDYDTEEWYLDDAMVRLTPMPGPSRTMTVNGEKINVDSDGIDEETLLLYPGVYSFGKELTKYLDIDPASRVMLPGAYTVGVDGRDFEPQTASGMRRTPDVELTEDGQREAQRLLDDHIDDCAAEAEKITPGCPFGADELTVPDDPDGSYYGEVEDLEWEIQDYPEATVMAHGGEFHYADRKPGSVVLTGSGEDDGETIDFEMTCEIRSNSLRFTVDSDGTARLYPNGGYSGVEQLDPDPWIWDTCGR